MNPERWRRIEALFHRAIALEGDERAALLRDECGSDLDLRDQVHRLLRDDAAQGDLFDQLEERTRTEHADPLLGRTLAAYRIVALLAEGGMGVVYRAERTDGLFEREVAIKLIRAEHASESLVRRFGLERRALAALDHPCIARLLDGGATEDGRPFLVMELVQGVAIDLHCEREALPVAARLRLFVQVCRAVHYAHQNLIVHRDLKPGNILIDEQGRPKLLDFGIARLLEDENGGPPAATRAPARILTPEYASPEQLTGGPVTTAIDVYSLGVILYELLTGRRLVRSRSRSPADWERMVRELAPTRPSTIVMGTVAAPGDEESGDAAGIAARFGTTPAGLRRRLRGDLDRIVLMALRKEPDRRYSSAQELADDIENHLAGRPVLARGDSLRYRAAKFVRRNRAAVVAASVVLLALFLGLFSSRRSEALAMAQAGHARIEAQSSQEIAEFLMDAFLPAMESPDGEQHALDKVLLDVERVRRQYADRDHLRANLLDVLGLVCQRIGALDDAESLMREALEIRAKAFGPTSTEYALSLRSLGRLAYRRGDFEGAAQELREALALNRASEPSTHTDVAAVANDLAACLRASGHAPEAEELHLEALELRRKDAPDSLAVAESLNNLAGVELDRSDNAAAAKNLEEALAIRSGILGPRHALTLQTTSNLANAEWQLGQRDRAHELVARAREGYRSLGLDGEEGLGVLLSNFARMQIAEGDPDGAEASLGEALELQSERLGPEHPLVAITLTRLAMLAQTRGHTDEARELWHEVLAVRRAHPREARDLCESLYDYGLFLSQIGACDEAVPVLVEALEGLRALERQDTLAEGRAELALGSCLAKGSSPAEASLHLRTAVQLLEENPRATPAERSTARERLRGAAGEGGE